MILGAGPVEAQSRTRDEALAAIEELGSARKPGRFEHERMKLLCDDFLARFEKDEEAANVRQRLGLACAALGEDARAAAELAAVSGTAKPGSDFRNFTLYALGESQIRLGEVAAARASLGALLAEAPGSKLAGRARSDLADLDRVGAPAGPLAKHPAVAAKDGVRVVALARGQDPIGDLGLPRDAIPLLVAGWEDPLLKDFPIPSLPRVYVLDGEGRVRAAGVRGEGIARAAARAREPWPGSR